MVASRKSSDKVSPLEQFTGRKIDAKIDLRISFGDYVHAVNLKKDNQVENANTHSCIAVRQTGSLTRSFVKRDQFTNLTMPEEVIKMLDAMAAKDGITRTTNLFEGNSPGDKGSASDDDQPPRLIEGDESDDDEDETDKGPTVKPVPPDSREMRVNDVDIEDVENEDDLPDVVEPEVPIESDQQANEAQANQTVPQPQDDWVRRSVRLARQIGLVVKTETVRPRLIACKLPNMVEPLSKRLTEQDRDSTRRAIRRELEHRDHYHDTEYAFKMSVKAAMRTRPK